MVNFVYFATIKKKCLIKDRHILYRFRKYTFYKIIYAIKYNVKRTNQNISKLKYIQGSINNLIFWLFRLLHTACFSY